jgi:hypothetical protein
LIVISVIIWSFIYNLLHIALSSGELLEHCSQYWGTLPLFPHWIAASGYDRPVHLCQILFFSWYTEADKNQIVLHCHHLKVMWDCHHLRHTSIRVPLWTLSCAFVALQMSSWRKCGEVELVE